MVLFMATFSGVLPATFVELLPYSLRCTGEHALVR